MARTRPVRVKDAHFLLDLLHSDTAPLQQYRELTENAVEAVVHARQHGLKDAGEILWTFSPEHWAEHGYWKLMLVDTGIGMSDEEMQEFINQLVCSGKVQGLDANYGVGARITAGAENPIGVVFQSWKDGVGSMVYFWKDPKTGEYGLRGEPGPDGIYGEVFEPEWKPDLIDDHGTVVILLGERIEENTCLPPPDSSQGSLWLSYYLNTRYYRFPDGVSIRVHEFNSTDTERWDPEGKEHRNLREVQGAHYYLDKYSVERGSVDVEGADIHWWLLEEDLGRKGGKYMPRYGHIAALWRDELYEVKEAKARTGMMHQFGVLLGGTRVVLYAEPSDSAGIIRSDAARRSLTLNQKTLPWEEWAEAFKEKFPPELEKYQQDLLARTEQDSDSEETLRERLKQIRDLLKIRRYKPGFGQAASQGEDEARIGTDAGVGGGANTREKSQQPRVFPVRPRGVRTTGQKGGEGSTEIDTWGEPPAVSWVSVRTGTREPNDGLEDRAAQYIPGDNHLLMNADFRGYKDLSQNIIKAFRIDESAQPVVLKAVREEAQFVVSEAVLGLRTLEGSKLWDRNVLDAAWSPESLTSVVMVRFHAIQAIKRRLGSTLGKLRAAS